MLTDQLYQLAQSKSADREQLVDQIEQLLEEREALLPAIQPPYSAEEQQLGREMVRRNAVIDAFLKQIKDEIQQDIKDLSEKKASVGKYTNPYASIQGDGMFYDKRN